MFWGSSPSISQIFVTPNVVMAPYSIQSQVVTCSVAQSFISFFLNYVKGRFWALATCLIFLCRWLVFSLLISMLKGQDNFWCHWMAGCFQNLTPYTSSDHSFNLQSFYPYLMRKLYPHTHSCDTYLLTYLIQCCV